MMPEPRRKGHMATVTPRSVGSLSFSGWQEHLRPLLTCDSPAYTTRQNLTQRRVALRLTQPSFDDDFTSFLYDLMSIICTR
jgi:hypothetical protein